MIKKGFTLIELLVVMAIIAILSAIIFPIMSSVREKTEQSTCMHNLKQIGMAIEMFHADNKAYPKGLAPEPQYDDNGDVIPINDATGNLLNGDYLPTYTTFHCPMDDRFEATDEVAVVNYNKNNVNISKEIYAYSSYEAYINDETIVDEDGKYTDPTAVLSYSREWWKLGNNQNPDEDYARQLKWKNPPANTVVCWCMNHADYPYSGNQNEYPTKGRCLVLFLDGHVDVYVDTKQVASAKWTIEPNHYAL